jgi:UDP-N-acetylglucosamine 2-epimerase (non-hydrolysing)
MTGLATGAILRGVEVVTRLFAERETAGIVHPIPDGYCIMNTSERIVSLLLGTAKISNAWDGIRNNDLT